MPTTAFEITAQALDGHLQYYATGQSLYFGEISPIPPSGPPQHSDWEDSGTPDSSHAHRGMLWFKTGIIPSGIQAASITIESYTVIGSPSMRIYAVNEANPADPTLLGYFDGPVSSNPDVYAPQSPQRDYVELTSSPVSPVGTGPQTFTLDASKLQDLSRLPGFIGTFGLVLVPEDEWTGFSRSTFVPRGSFPNGALYRSFLELPNSVGPTPILTMTYSPGAIGLRRAYATPAVDVMKDD